MKTLNFDYDNMPGVSLMYAVPTTSFYQCLQNPMTGDCTLTLVNPDDIIEIPIYIGDSFKHEEVQQFEDGGDCWDVTVSGIIPKRCQINESIIHRLERGEWITVTRDANGIILLSGTVDVPLKFVHSRTTGTSGDMNGSKFTFQSRQSEPSVVLASLPTVV